MLMFLLVPAFCLANDTKSDCELCVFFKKHDAINRNLTNDNEKKVLWNGPSSINNTEDLLLITELIIKDKPPTKIGQLLNRVVAF